MSKTGNAVADTPRRPTGTSFDLALPTRFYVAAPYHGVDGMSCAVRAAPATRPQHQIGAWRREPNGKNPPKPKNCPRIPLHCRRDSGTIPLPRPHWCGWGAGCQSAVRFPGTPASTRSLAVEKVAQDVARPLNLLLLAREAAPLAD